MNSNVLAIYLVAFQIIQDKMVDMDLFHKTKKLHEYNDKSCKKLTISEYNFLKDIYKEISC